MCGKGSSRRLLNGKIHPADGCVGTRYFNLSVLNAAICFQSATLLSGEDRCQWRYSASGTGVRKQLGLGASSWGSACCQGFLEGLAGRDRGGGALHTCTCTQRQLPSKGWRWGPAFGAAPGPLAPRGFTEPRTPQDLLQGHGDAPAASPSPHPPSAPYSEREEKQR